MTDDPFSDLFDAMINWPNGTATEEQFRQALRGVLAAIADECGRYSMDADGRRVVVDEVLKWGVKQIERGG